MRRPTEEEIQKCLTWWRDQPRTDSSLELLGIAEHLMRERDVARRALHNAVRDIIKGDSPRGEIIGDEQVARAVERFWLPRARREKEASDVKK